MCNVNLKTFFDFSKTMIKYINKSDKNSKDCQSL